jgi:tryptophanyl-tRNA synthetase
MAIGDKEDFFSIFKKEAFDVPVVIQLTDDEKFFHKFEYSIEEY